MCVSAYLSLILYALLNNMVCHLKQSEAPLPVISSEAKRSREIFTAQISALEDSSTRPAALVGMTNLSIVQVLLI